MLYEAWGALLGRAESVLRDEVREHVTDPRARDQLDVVCTLLGDLAAMWPGLFAGVVREAELLAGGAGVDSARPAPRTGDDPLEAHRRATAALNERISALRELPAAQRAQATEQVRAAILAAAEVQSTVVRATVDRAAGAKVRRM
jgi:hypothetical protein